MNDILTLAQHRTMEDKTMSSSLPHEIAGESTAELSLRHIAACVSDSAMSELVVPHAVAIARAFAGRVTVLHVLTCTPTSELPTDPLEWEIRRREAREHVDHVVRESAADVPISGEVVESGAVTEIGLWAERHHVDLMVLCGCAPRERQWSLARTFLDQMFGSVLIVPTPLSLPVPAARYRRLLVAVDGSARAESAIPLAVRVAVSSHAELLVVHVVPAPSLTEVGPPDSEDLELRERITRRNVAVASAYLDRLRARFAASGAPPRTMVVRNGDVRTRLERLVEDEAVDLVVLSSHGHTGRSGVPYGSVTADLVLHSSVPLLIVRPHHVGVLRTTTATAPGRLPHQATS